MEEVIAIVQRQRELFDQDTNINSFLRIDLFFVDIIKFRDSIKSGDHNFMLRCLEHLQDHDPILFIENVEDLRKIRAWLDSLPDMEVFSFINNNH